MEYFIALMFVPLIMMLIASHFMRDYRGNKTIDIGEIGMSSLVGILIGGLSLWFAYSSQTADHAIINGEVLSKHRVHDTYMESYSCNCYTSCSGTGTSRSCSTTCQTCYRKHWTVDWKIKTTIGGIRLDYADSTSSSVYRRKDPRNYVEVQPGDACSKTVSYDNYIKAVPNSLFNMDADYTEFAEFIPNYPRVFDRYKVNHLIDMVGVEGAGVINENLGLTLRTLGPQKEMNMIVVLTPVSDPTYRYALERAWLGAKKNDAVVIVGIDPSDKKTIMWADVITLANNSGNSLFTVTIREEILAIKQLTNQI